MENFQLTELNFEMDEKRYAEKKKKQERGEEKKVKWSNGDVCCVHGFKIYLSSSVQFDFPNYLILRALMPMDQHFRYSLANRQ